MSLLDDVSIVVTPNGYKAGELYAVIPVPTEGAEEIVDGGFANDLDDWSKYGVTSATGGIATIGANANSGIYQTILTEGVRYTVTINVTSYDGVGLAQVTNGNGTVLYLITETGIQTFTFISAIASGQLIIRGLSNALFSLSSVSVKEYTSADMDVTRATAATRVDENGLVNYAEVIGGEEVTCGDFSCAVPLDSWTITSGVTITDKATISTTGSMQYISSDSANLVSGKSYKISLTATRTLGTGLLAFTDNVGNNITGTPLIDSDGDLNYYFTAQSDITGFGFKRHNSGTYAWEIDNVSVKEVTRDNVPRIDYTGGGCPHILAEPQRTNLIPYSEDLTNAFYNAQALNTVTQSLTLSPDGVNYGYTITPNTITSNHWMDYEYSQVTVTIGNEITYSIFVKPNGYNFIQIAASTGFSTKFQNFELTGDGVIGAGNVDGKTIEKIGDWYRISVTQISIAANPRFLLIPSPTALATRNASFTGNGTDGVLGWGVQVEEGSYATSYIPTSGSTVTRNQDIFTRDGISSLINSTEGVLFVEMAALSNDGTFRIISLTDGGTTNRVSLIYNTSNNNIRVMVVSTSTVFDTSNSVTSTLDFHKIAIKWKLDDFAVWIDGVEVATDTSGNAPVGLDRIVFDVGNGALNFFGKVKQLQVYKTALTDAQLTSLTL